MIHILDFSLNTPQQRNEAVKAMLQETPPQQLKPKYLETLADYLIFAMDKQQRKQKTILTENRLVTINRRETSYEGLCDKLQTGESGIAALTNDLGKSARLTIKQTISKEDVEKSPQLQEVQQAIARLEEKIKTSSGKTKFLLKKQLIEMRQDQYVIRNGYDSLIPHSTNTIRSIAAIELPDIIEWDQKNFPINKGPISLFNPDHIEALLCNYTAIKDSCREDFQHDFYYLIIDFDNLIAATMPAYPALYDILKLKIDGYSNIEIKRYLQEHHNLSHCVEYISALWHKKIPKILADAAREEYINWYYTVTQCGHWKRCTRCGQSKLAHPLYYSRNSSSADGFYSICKECRSKKHLADKKVK